ncbi:MAG: hypothetical protein PHG40_00615 [Candidatus Omnitrophica bacterium]|nr:hypothetical protein [Candidatus Omnitrophota bacterium]
MRRSKAQNTLEYCMLIGVIALALLAMQVYLKRGAQGRIRGYADELSEGFGYSPGASSADNVITRNITENSKSYSEGKVGEIKKSVTDSSTTIHQNIQRRENTLPFGAEPKR